MGNKSFLTRQEAMRLYDVCNEMILPYSYSAYSSDVFDVWENIANMFGRMIVSAAHLTDKFKGVKTFNFNKMAELAHLEDFGKGFVDWYSGYGGSTQVLEGCGLMADSLAGAENFAQYFVSSELDMLEVAQEIVKALESEYGSKEPAVYKEDAKLAIREEVVEPDEEEEYDEEEHIEKLTYEFAEAVCAIYSNTPFEIADYQGLEDFFAAVCYMYALEEDEVESEEFFIEHLREFLICMFGGGGVSFVDNNKNHFRAMACLNIWRSRIATDTFRRLKNKENLTDEEKVFMWACHSISGSYYVSNVCGLSDVLTVKDELLFFRVMPEVCDSSEEFNPLYNSFAHLFAPLILEALCDEGGDEKCG